MKAFKDFEISDFSDMGSLPAQTEKPVPSKHRPFFGFNKTKKGTPSKPFEKHPVSNLADVL